MHHKNLLVLPRKSIPNNRDIFYDKMVWIFLMKTMAKPHVKRLKGGVQLEGGAFFVALFQPFFYSGVLLQVA